MGKPGFIKSWRKELESDIWSMPPLYHRVWHYLLRSVSWEKNIFPTRNLYGIHLNPGQQLYSIQQIAEGVSWVERNVKKTPNKKTILNILSWLEFHRAVVRESNGNGTFISICNWEKYQTDGAPKVTAKVTQSIPQSTHTKEVKEDKEEKKTATTTTGKPAKVSFDPIAYRPEYIPEELWIALLDNRKFKKLQNSEVALKVICKQFKLATEAGFDIEDCIGTYISSGWQTFKPEYMRPRGTGQKNQEGKAMSVKEKHALALLEVQ